MKKTIVEINGLYKSFGSKVVLNNADLVLESGIYMLSGPSGCGKTTLARLICGLDKPDRGIIKLDGRASYMFQEPRLFPWLNLTDNITEVSGGTVKGVSKLLELVELYNDMNKYPYELSGGMQRRVALVRALARDAELYIFDEPLAGLDERLRNKVCDIIKETLPRTAAALIITHNIYEVERISDGYIRMDDGKLVIT